jgi:hypothetical protein
MAQGGKSVPVAPPTLDEAIKQGGQLGRDPSFWEKAKAFATTPRIPAEQLLKTYMPPGQELPGSTPPILGTDIRIPNEVVAGLGLTGARAIESMSSPLNAGLGIGAGLLGEIGAPGMILKGLFSGNMLKGAYDQFMKPGDPKAPLRERIADKGSGVMDALMALLPWKGDIKAGIRNRGVSAGRAPVEASVPGLPPPVPKAVEPTLQPPPPMAAPSPAVRPGPVQANPVEAVAVPKTPYNPEADPWYQKAVQDIADQETSKRAYQEALAARRTPPGGWENTPESVRAEATARQTAPVGDLALKGEAEQAGPLPEMRKPYEQIVAEFAQNAAEMKLEQMKSDFLGGTGGLSGKARSFDTSGMNVKATHNLTQHDTGFGRINVRNAYQDILQGYGATNPKRIGEALQRKSPRANKVYNDLLGRARKLALEDPDLKESARQRFLEQFSEADDSPEAIAAFEKHGPLTGEEGFARISDKEDLRLNKTQLKILGSAKSRGSAGQTVFLPNATTQSRSAMQNLREMGLVEYAVKEGHAGNWLTEKGKAQIPSGEEGFARIKDEGDLGRVVKPEDFTYGFIGSDGKTYQIKGDHMQEMAKAMGKEPPARYHLMDFEKDMGDSNIIRARRSPRTLVTQAFAPVTPGQRQSIAGMAKGVEPTNFNWETPKGKSPWGFGLGEFLRATDAGNLPVAIETKTADNPLLNAVDEFAKPPKKK